MKVPSITFTILGAFWILAIGVGTFVLMQYEHTPGVSNLPSLCWPDDSKIYPNKEGPTLLMFAHPQCPCTRASISELAQLMTQCKIPPKAYVLFYSPKSMPIGWEKTDLWQSAQNIPGVTVLSDINGMEAHRFNSVTSGKTLIYNAKGELLFNGGITVARGQAGDNFSLDSAILTLNREPVINRTTLVYGCSLIGTNNK